MRSTRSTIARTRARALGQALAWLGLAGATFAAGIETAGDEIYRELQSLRGGENLAGVARWPVLDRVALRRAEEIARAPAARRLPPARPLESLLSEEPDLGGRRVIEQIDIHARQPDAAQVARSWREHAISWDNLLQPRLEAVGVATRPTEDGNLIIVTLYVEQRDLPTDLDRLERQTEAAINRIREAEGLLPLTLHRPLVEIARSHSRDMAQRAYFDHLSPEGRGHGDRARARGLSFRLLSENIGKTREIDDPVVVIVDGWVNSPGHRANLLHPRVRRTGVGIALGEDGVLYFTQLFLLSESTAPRLER